MALKPLDDSDSSPMSAALPEQQLRFESQWQDFTRLWGLKLATLAWLILATTSYAYLGLATALDWTPIHETLPDRQLATQAWPLTVAAGGMGATLYTIRGFYWAVGPQSDSNALYQYDPNWTWWYFLRPLIGALIGILAYVVTRVVLTPFGLPAPTSSTEVSSHMLVAFGAGFSLTQVLSWLGRWISAVFR